MSPQVASALIAATGVVMSAVIAGLISFRNARLTRQTAHEVERIHIELEHLQDLHARGQILLPRQRDAIRKVGAALQNAREELREVLASGISSNQREAVSRAITACNEMRDRYAEEWTELPETVQPSFHLAKKCLIRIRRVLRSLDSHSDTHAHDQRERTVARLRSEAVQLDDLHRSIVTLLGGIGRQMELSRELEPGGRSGTPERLERPGRSS